MEEIIVKHIYIVYNEMRFHYICRSDYHLAVIWVDTRNLGSTYFENYETQNIRDHIAFCFVEC